MFARRRRPSAASLRPARSSTRRRGDRGEDLAAREAAARGWRVLARNHRCKLGEVDLVAVDGQVLVFVEVKARAARGYAQQALTRAKRRRVVLAALDFAARRRVDLGAVPFRFDVCEVRLAPDPRDDRAIWVENAFDAEGLGLDF